MTEMPTFRAARSGRSRKATYDEDAPHRGIARQFKNIKKYAVSRSGEVDTSWAGSVLLRDIA